MCHRRVTKGAPLRRDPSQPACASAVDRGCKNPPTGTEATRPSPAKHRCPREGRRRRGGDSAYLGRASAGVKQCPGWSHALRTTSFVGLKDRWLCRPVVGAIRAIDVALLGCLAPHGSGLKLTPGFDLTDLICHGLKPFGATGHGPSPLAGCSRLAKNPGVRQEVAGSAGRGLLIPHTPVGAELPCRP
jgi:hypothetical protein